MTDLEDAQMTRTEVISLMRSASTHGEWADNCARVKQMNGGAYPSFWYTDVLEAGIFDALRRRVSARIVAVYP